jgi:PilZ domain
VSEITGDSEQCPYNHRELPVAVTPEGIEMPERRRFKRIQKRYIVDFHAAGRACSGFTHNLSPMGMFVCSVYLPKPGTLLRLRMKTPAGKTILLGARVVRSYKVPSQLARFVPSGFCVLLQHAPEEYFQLIASLLRIAA